VLFQFTLVPRWDLQKLLLLLLLSKQQLPALLQDS